MWPSAAGVGAGAIGGRDGRWAVGGTRLSGGWVGEWRWVGGGSIPKGGSGLKKIIQKNKKLIK